MIKQYFSPASIFFLAIGCFTTLFNYVFRWLVLLCSINIKLVRTLSFWIIIVLLTNHALASDGNDIDQCKQVIVVGDINWPPYAIQQEENYNTEQEDHPPIINGIGIDIVKLIFAELDIPVQVVQLDNRRNIFNGLHLGDIDILVSTYANKEIEEIVDVIKPGYLLDPVVVYMRKGNEIGINRWDDLIGKRGVMTDHFLFDANFEDYINRYLYIHARGSLAKVINLVGKRKADYVIGSKLQLAHGIQQAGLQEELKLLANISNTDEVHMGYAKNSLCRTYLPYLRKRLLDLKEDGTINDIITKYSVKNKTNVLPDANSSKLEDADEPINTLLDVNSSKPKDTIDEPIN